MNTHRIRLSSLAWAVLVLAAAGSTSALADSKSRAAEAQALYQQERAVCLSGQSNQDRATCLREAGAAFAQAKREGWDAGQDAQYLHNARVRCERLPDTDRRDCMSRMQGQGTTSGSAAGGGIYRELVTREAALPSAAPAAPPAAAQ
jgi:hypothetical protein